jgi:fermentation-respiration switch protein FrsA (DUF1100 family)
MDTSAIDSPLGAAGTVDLEGADPLPSSLVVPSSHDRRLRSLTGKRLLIVLAWLAVAMVVTLGLVWVFQRSLIYLPTQLVPSPPPGVAEVSYATEDGLTLTAWLVESEASRGSVIVFNGNAGNRSHRLPLARALADIGLTVLLTDYRGYGGNPGSPSEDGLALDARAAIGYMTDRAENDSLIYFGESLGAGVAIGLAIQHPPGAMILRSPFTSLPDIAGVHYRWLPSSLLLKDRYQNLNRVGDVEAPLLVITGTEDSIVPSEQSEAVYQAANQPKEILLVDGANHNDTALLDGDEMIEGISGFLDGVLND